MYIHLLLKGNRGAPAVAEGNADQIAELLTMWATEDLYEVWDGVEYKDAREFVAKTKGFVRPSEGHLTPEEKMRHEDLFDPNIHARNETVHQLISKALRLAEEEDFDYDAELVAKKTSQEIIRLFY